MKLRNRYATTLSNFQSRYASCRFLKTMTNWRKIDGFSSFVSCIFCQQFMVLCWHNFSNYLKKSKIKYEIKLQISCILSLFLFFCISSMYASMFAWHFNLWIGRHTVGQIPQNVKKPQTWCVCHWYGLFYFCLFVLFIL